MIRIASLFSGVGTPEQSLKHLQVEHETIFACEIDKYARQTYLANNQEPNTFYEDVYNIDGKQYLNQIDILIGGSPCQSFSIAGKRLGTSCPRGNLIYEYFRIVEESQPKVFIYENVKGFLSIDKGETFENFKNSFKEIGYTVYHQVLNTKDYGIPQNRERIYIVGFKDNVDFHFQEKQELKLKLKDMLEDSVDSKYLLNQELVEKYIQTGTASNHKGSQAGKVADETDETFWTVNAGSHGYSMGYVKTAYPAREVGRRLDENGTRCDNDTSVPITRRYEVGNKEVSNCLSGVQKDSYIAVANGLIEVTDEVRVKEAVKKGYTVAEEGDSINISVPSSKTRRGRAGKQVAQTLDTACNQVVFTIDKSIKPSVAKNIEREMEDILKSDKDFYVCKADAGWQDNKIGLKTSPTIRANNSSIYGLDRANYIFRKLTPRECFRLQGFDDSFIFVPKMSDTQLYKQAGNGMSRNILDMIFTQIFTCYAKHIEENNE